MVDLGEEAHLGRRHGVLVGQEELERKAAALVGRALGAREHDIEVAQVVVVRLRVDAGHGLGHEPLGLADDALAQTHGVEERAHRGSEIALALLCAINAAAAEIAQDHDRPVQRDDGGPRARVRARDLPHQRLPARQVRAAQPRQLRRERQLEGEELHQGAAQRRAAVVEEERRASCTQQQRPRRRFGTRPALRRTCTYST